MPVKFYHIVLESGKDAWLNPDHIMVAKEFPQLDGMTEWELTLANGYQLNIKPNSKFDNSTLIAKITAKHPA